MYFERSTLGHNKIMKHKHNKVIIKVTSKLSSFTAQVIYLVPSKY